MTFNKRYILIGFILLAAAGWWKNSQEFLSPSPYPATLQDRNIEPTRNSPIFSGPSSTLTPEVLRQVQILDEILASKNDNDLRMDTELKTLNSQAKIALREKYFNLPETQRNARGTIVFLLGRNLTDPSDYQFLKQVLSESPCMGLVDCARPMNVDEAPGHEDNGMGVVLDYPQLTALKAIEKYPATTDLLKGFQAEVLQAAKASRSTKVSEAAEFLARRLR